MLKAKKESQVVDCNHDSKVASLLPDKKATKYQITYWVSTLFIIS